MNTHNCSSTLECWERKWYSGSKEHMSIRNSVKISQNKCGSQPLRWAPGSPISLHSHPYWVSFHAVPSWSVWPVEHDRSDGTPLLRFDSIWHHSFPLGCPLIFCHPWNTHSGGSRLPCPFRQPHGEATKQESDTSSQHLCEWAFLMWIPQHQARFQTIQPTPWARTTQLSSWIPELQNLWNSKYLLFKPLNFRVIF